MKEKIPARESVNVGLGRGRDFRFGVPIKQRCVVELFDGPPMFKLSNGRQIRHEEINTHRMDRDLWRELWMGSEHKEQDGLVEVIPEIFLPADNRKLLLDTHNIITNRGLNTMADLFLRTTPAPTLVKPAGMKLGTSSTAASAGDVDVITALSGSFKIYSANYPARTSSIVSFRSFWAAGEATSATINEVVQKTSDTSATGVSRIVLTTVNKGASDTLQITVSWDFDRV